jgi:hypothetical protein
LPGARAIFCGSLLHQAIDAKAAGKIIFGSASSTVTGTSGIELRIRRRTCADASSSQVADRSAEVAVPQALLVFDSSRVGKTADPMCYDVDVDRIDRHPLFDR